MYKKILIATDGSELSAKAVSSGIELATALKAELVVLYVVPPYPGSYYEGSFSIGSSEIAAVEESWTKNGEAVIDAVRQSASVHGLKAEGVVLHSNLVAETILEVAKEKNCDLIVMASHGRKGLQRVLLGSETQHVLTHSHSPVLVLR